MMHPSDFCNTPPEPGGVFFYIEAVAGLSG